MSFGFSVGDFIAAGDLAWRLYRDCYKIARGAPQEFQLLVGEISTLSHSLKLLREEVDDPESALVLAGEDRVRMVNDVVANIRVTLAKLEKVAKRYEILGSGSKTKQIWAKFKWSVDFSSIDALRNKLVYHNTVMNLLLTSIGNSSLQRIASTTDVLESDVKAIKDYITAHQSSDPAADQISVSTAETLLANAEDPENAAALAENSSVPTLTAIDDETFRLSLSAAFMKNAEIFQSWSTIGVDQWIESGRWWLLRAQMDLYAVESLEQKVTLVAYTNMIKASWILIDIIARHPQMPFLSATAHAEVQILSTEIRNEFERLKRLDISVPDLSELEDQDLRIWETHSRGPMLRPHKGPRSAEMWAVEGDEKVLFQRFAKCELRRLPEPQPCILLFLFDEKKHTARIVAQNQSGALIMSFTYAQILICMIEATVFYLHERAATFWDIDDLRAYTLLAAVKCHRDEAALSLIERLAPVPGHPNEVPENITALAASMAVAQAKHELKEGMLPDWDFPLPQMSFFCWAVLCGHTQLLDILLNKEKSSPRGGDWRGVTPLGMAARIGNESIVRLLINNGHDVRERRAGKRPPLHDAAFHGHEKVARLLLRHGAEINAKDDDDQTALSRAAREGHDKVVQLLLDKGINSEIRSRGGFTTIAEACDAAHEDVIMLLVEEGVNLKVKIGADGITPLHIAVERSCLMLNHTSRILSRQCLEAVWDKYFEQTSPNPPLHPEKRRAVVKIYLDSDWGILWLDSREARIEYREHPLPDHIVDMYSRAIGFRRPPGAEKFFQLTYTVNVIHQSDTLSFSTGHGDSAGPGPHPDGAGSMKVSVEGGGTFTATPHRTWRNFRSWTGIQTAGEA